MSDKLFKDPVHGYIPIPEEFCSQFIDTPIFQRLRYIEQTSMRCLFPGAHHDRFIHSLGVFHLGRQMYCALLKNSAKAAKSQLKDPCLQNTFLIACLMHDCGHSPFSHTLERFYNDNGAKGGRHEACFKQLKSLFGDEDFTIELPFHPADHEAMSAIVLKECFDQTHPFIEWDPKLAARMITGCRHHPPIDARRGIENILISLLNGTAIDADKLDYIIRDTWASGVKNNAVDLQRLIESLTIVQNGGDFRLTYQKSAVSVIQSVIDARNYLYEWIYNHHTVVYFAEMLKRAVLALGRVLDQGSAPGQSLSRLFSLDAFKKKVLQREGREGPYAYLPTDGDILMLLKMFCPTDPSYLCYASHKPLHFPVWKTEAEFRAVFGTAPTITPEQCLHILPSQLGIPTDDVIICDGKAKLHTLKENEIFIEFNGMPVPFTRVTHSVIASTPVPFFYLYVPNAFRNRKRDILNALLSEEVAIY